MFHLNILVFQTGKQPYSFPVLSRFCNGLWAFCTLPSLARYNRPRWPSRVKLNNRCQQFNAKTWDYEQSRIIVQHHDYLYWFKLLIQLLDCVFGCFNLSLCFSHFVGYLPNAVKTIITNTLESL